ncbi:PorV/PorQ family protein [candidate division GN15 bacterium]|nr:PorV/PorQ family protein [candidate division GN15 bacterium]
MKITFYKPIAVILATVLLTVPTVLGQDGLALMKVETGARQAGMGGAAVSLSGDPASAAYNPANAAILGSFKTTLDYNTYWEDVSLQTGYVSATLSRRLWLHGGIRFAGIDNLEARTSPTIEPEGYFDAHDVSFKAGLTYRLSDKLTAGAAAGWFVEKIAEYRGSAFNLDVGLNYRATRDLSLGASAVNVGSDLRLGQSGKEGVDVPIPTSYRFGGSYRYDRFLGAADLVYVDDEAHVHVGAEGMLHESVALRAGYMAGYDSKDFTAGATFSHRNFDVNYAFVPFSNDLGTSHLFSLTVSL